jgi:TPR repeat protein
MYRWLAMASLAWICSVAAAPEDDFRAGERAFRSGDVVGAMAPLRRAAEAGHAPAQALYGYILDQAESNEEAAAYYRKAAEQGNAEGEFGLGKLLAAGEGVAKDPAAARGWFERAAGKGHALAINVLAQAFLASDLGYKRDPADVKGLSWVRKAAENRHLPALEYLAKGYRSGEFGKADIAQAEKLEARIREIRPEPAAKGRARKSN